VGILEEVFNPGAHRAREELDRQNELVIAVPSPGDRLLTEGKLVIDGRLIGESDPIG
jgi:hypothetical protein